MSVQVGTASSPSGAGKSAAAPRSKWLKKKSGTPLSKTTTWTSGSVCSSVTISASLTTVSPTMRLTGGFVKVTLAIWGELVVELEDAAVTGVGVDDQFGALDPAMEIIGEHGGDHPVVVAVGDQGRLGDLRQVGGGRAAPSLDCLQLGLERLDRDRLVAIRGALFEAFDERLGGALASGVAVEEQELLRIPPGESGAQYVVVGRSGDLVDVLPAGRAGAGEDELADELQMLGDEGLGDHAAEREGEDVDRVEAERLDEADSVVGHRLDAVGHGAGGGADATVVEGDHVVPLGDRVDDARVPVVQRGGEVDEEDHRDSTFRSQLAVGVGDVARRDRARGCVLVRRDHALSRLWFGAHD